MKAGGNFIILAGTICPAPFINLSNPRVSTVEDSNARGVVHLDMVHQVWEWGFIFRSARVNLIVGPSVGLRCCGFTVCPAWEIDFREENIRRKLDVRLRLDHDAVNADGFDGDRG